MAARQEIAELGKSIGGYQARLEREVELRITAEREGREKDRVLDHWQKHADSTQADLERCRGEMELVRQELLAAQRLREELSGSGDRAVVAQAREEVARLQSQWQAEKAETRRAFQEQIQTLQRTHQEQIQGLQREANELKRLQAEVQALRRDNAELRRGPPDAAIAELTQLRQQFSALETENARLRSTAPDAAQRAVSPAGVPAPAASVSATVEAAPREASAPREGVAQAGSATAVRLPPPPPPAAPQNLAATLPVPSASNPPPRPQAAKRPGRPSQPQPQPQPQPTMRVIEPPEEDENEAEFSATAEAGVEQHRMFWRPRGDMSMTQELLASSQRLGPGRNARAAEPARPHRGGAQPARRAAGGSPPRGGNRPSPLLADFGDLQQVFDELTPEEQLAVRRLFAPGVSPHEAIQVYIACEKNEEAARLMVTER